MTATAKDHVWQQQQHCCCKFACDTPMQGNWASLGLHMPATPFSDRPGLHVYNLNQVCSRTDLARTATAAASAMAVLPAPVGAHTSTDLPSRKRRTACCWKPSKGNWNVSSISARVRLLFADRIRASIWTDQEGIGRWLQAFQGRQMYAECMWASIQWFEVKIRRA